MVFESFDFWAESFWLPANVTWADIEKIGGKHQKSASFQILIYPWALAIFIIIIRNILKRTIFLPLGIYLKVNHTVERAEHNTLLEESFKNSSFVNEEMILRLVKQTDWSKERVSRWWKIRSAENKSSLLSRFCECSCNALFFIWNVTYAVVILWNKHWVWVQNEIFTYVPYQIESELRWHYLISIGFYWFVLFGVIKKYKEHYFLEYFFHHVITILLLLLSHFTNTYRIGCIILLTHDLADIFLELSKVAKYASYNKVAKVIFALFTMIWLVTRMYILPFHIILRAIIWEPVTSPALRFIAFILWLLFSIHIYWTYQIILVFCGIFYENKKESRRQSKPGHQESNLVMKEPLTSMKTTGDGNNRKVD